MRMAPAPVLSVGLFAPGRLFVARSPVALPSVPAPRSVLPFPPCGRSLSVLALRCGVPQPPSCGVPLLFRCRGALPAGSLFWSLPAVSFRAGGLKTALFICRAERLFVSLPCERSVETYGAGLHCLAPRGRIHRRLPRCAALRRLLSRLPQLRPQLGLPALRFRYG